jgi:predicted protein tyrosine phosphatase
MESTPQVPPSAFMLEAIFATAKHPKAKRAAEHVRDACDYLAEHGIEISVPEVGRLCDKTGPKEQSIRNNKRLMSYVKVRRSEQTLRVQMKSKEVRYETNDVQANAMIYALEADVRREKSQKQNLKQALANAGEYDLNATMRTGKLVGADVASVVKRLMDPEHLQKFGLTIRTDRIIALDRNNRVFMEKSDVQQLMALIKKDASPGL